MVETVYVSIKPKLRNQIVLIKRTKTCVLKNYEQLLHYVKFYSYYSKLYLTEHDDSHLPAVSSQLRRFAEAKIVIGPLGAGLVNIIASSPNTCVIEFLSSSINICYMRLSFVTGLNYVSIPLYNNQYVSIYEFGKALVQCHRFANKTI